MTNISLPKELVDQLKALKHKGQSYAGFISELVDKHYKKRGQDGKFIKPTDER